MPTERVERRLAAILAADVVGYSRLMGADEEGTLAQLKAHRRALVDPKITEHRGRIVKTTGDGMLMEFASVVDALRCAVEVQLGMSERNTEVPQEKRIEFRVGINVGDIIIDGDDIYGDGVNIAARLEGLAEPGGICVSARVQEDARGKLDLAFEDAGEQQLKNINWPVRAYRIRLNGTEPRSRPTLPLPDKPSIAVLPFQNMSGDPEQEYFADGVVEEIITALSRFKQLFVIARNSSFTYKGRAVDVKQVGRELGVRYVLEGSVRKAADRLRITGQLIDATTGSHIWADRFDGALTDIFDLQDQVTTNVIGAIAPKLEQAEIERSKQKPTNNLDAYDYFLRGTAKVYQWNEQANEEALPFFYKAIALDPEFASAYGYATWCHAFRKTSGWMANPAQDVPETERLARQAIEVGKEDAFALCWAGYSLACVVGQLEEGIGLIDRALVLNPNLARAWNLSGWARIWRGEPDIAIEHFKRAIRLSPLDFALHTMQNGIASAHFFAGRYQEALSWVELALRQRPNDHSVLRMSSVVYSTVGRLAEATEAITRLRQIDPALSLANVRRVFGPYRPNDLTRYEDGLRKAGLPE